MLSSECVGDPSGKFPSVGRSQCGFLRLWEIPVLSFGSLGDVRVKFTMCVEGPRVKVADVCDSSV